MNFKNLLKYAYRYIPIGVRYGKVFRDTCKLLVKTQFADSSELQAFQFHNLKKLLTYSFENVPYYRRLFKDCCFDPYKFNKIDEIKNIPFLTKQMLRDNEQDLLSDTFPRSHMQYAQTGGTTGVPLGFYKEKKRSIAIERAFVLTAFEWGGYSQGARMAVLRGDSPPASPREKARKIWSYDPLRNMLILSSYDINEKNLPVYIKALKKFDPHFIHAYPSSLHLLTTYLLRHGEKIRGIKAIFTSSETLYEFQRQDIEAFFNSRIYDLYGNKEQTCFAAQCGDSDGYHIFPEYGLTEIINPDGKHVTGDGESGEIVSTSFYNYAMPFIRYRTGDIVTCDSSDCRCGRRYQKIKEIYGRVQDYFVASDNSLVPLTGDANMLILSKIEGVVQSQYLQTKPGEVTLNIVKKGDLSEVEENAVLTGLQGRYGDLLKFHVESVDSIQTTKQGKHRMLVQKLPVSLQ